MARQKIQWVEHTPKVPGIEFGDFAAELRKRPGCWAVVPTGDRSAAQVASLSTNIKRNVAFQPQGDFRFSRRRGTLYACYVGKE